MRSYRITDFPDPNSQGLIQIPSSSDLNPNSPQFEAAQEACEPRGSLGIPIDAASDEP